MPKGVAGSGGRRPGGHRSRALCFGRSEGGAAAVEFALVALPFLALLGGSLEIALSFWAQANLEQAVYEAARDVYTGSFQNANAKTTNTTQLISAFKNSICTDGGKAKLTLFNCANVRVNVIVHDDFAGLKPVSATQTDTQTGETGWNPAYGTTYACARSSSAVLIQAAVDYPVYFKLLNPTAVVLSGDRRILQAATVFRVEPYESKGACS